MTRTWWLCAMAVGCAGAASESDSGTPVEADTDTDTDADADTDTDADADADADTDADTDPADPAVTLTLDPEVIVAGESTILTVNLENFTLVDPTQSPAPPIVPGEGHYHLYIGDDPNYSAFWVPEIELQSDVADAGKSIDLRAVLVNSHHLEVGVEDTVTLTIE